MKGGSDGCVFGAWVRIDGTEHMLDLGTGNGYLGMMALQRATPSCQLYGSEVEPGAAGQTRENYASSKFAHRTHVFEGRFQDMEAPSLPPLDLILSNPPFYRGKPKSSVASRNLARHDDSLTMADILRGSSKLLKQGGRLATVWPIDREQEWFDLAEGFGFQLTRWTQTCPSEGAEVLRVMNEMTLGDESKRSTCTKPQKLNLERWKSNDSVPEFRALLDPYFRNWH